MTQKEDIITPEEGRSHLDEAAMARTIQAKVISEKMFTPKEEKKPVVRDTDLQSVKMGLESRLSTCEDKIKEWTKERNDVKKKIALIDRALSI